MLKCGGWPERENTDDKNFERGGLKGANYLGDRSMAK
jgi:hypothetical protein